MTSIKTKMAATSILSVGHFSLLNNSLKCLNVLKKDYSIKKVINANLIPPKPKKPSSPFVLYLTNMRNEVVADNPGKSFKEISRILSAKWKTLPESEKEKYRANFVEQYALYKNQLLEYNQNYGEVFEASEKIKRMVTSSKADRKGKKKMEIKNNKPQFPTNCYRFFIQENFKKVTPEESHGVSRLKKCAEMWKNLSDTEKDNYKKIFQEKYELYQKDLILWEENMIQEGKEHLITRNSEATKKFSKE